jgi:hypothetical protein
MKNYILTEEQLTRVLTEERPIKKGVAIKFSPGKGEDPVYQSYVLEFKDEQEWQDYKKSLPEKKEIIGIIDIKESISEKKNPVISESEIKRVDAGKKLLLRHIKDEYPFVIDVDINYVKKYGTFGYVNFKFNLNKFYDFYSVTPPKYYKKFDFLLPNLEVEGLYLFRYVDDEYNNEFGIEFNRKLEEHMNDFYIRLPENMRYSKFEDFSDEDFENDEGAIRDIDFYKRWQNEKEPVELKTDVFTPVVDLTKIKF